MSPLSPLSAAENTATRFNGSSPGKAGETSVVERLLAAIYFFLIGGFHSYIFEKSRLKAQVTVKLKHAQEIKIFHAGG